MEQSPDVTDSPECDGWSRGVTGRMGCDSGSDGFGG